mmetsp:Transcript_18157/g.15829  ORF Transcript_18157/g.15829 Transcript_18157/m.15829 type:complete len:101 (-) Transcript_18157:318-620(-)
MLKIKVKDTGYGIKPEDINKLFTMFGSLEETRAVNKKGIGLGLTICKELLEYLSPGNKIKVKSIYKQGSSFSFCVPLANNNDDDSISEILDTLGSPTTHK